MEQSAGGMVFNRTLIGKFDNYTYLRSLSLLRTRSCTPIKKTFPKIWAL